MMESGHGYAAICVAFLVAVLAGTGPAVAQDQAPVDTLLQGLDAAQADTARLQQLWKRAQEKVHLHPRQAMQYAQEALRLAQRLGEEAKVAESLRLLGQVHHVQGRFAQALTYYRRARDQAETAGDTQGVANVLVSMGRVYFVQGNYPKALRYHLRALERFEQGSARKRRAICLNNIGLIHDRQDNLEKALTYYDQAAQLHREIENRQGVAQVLHNVGLVLMKRQEYEKALERHRRALALYEELDDRGGEARVLNDIGVVLNKQGRPADALRHLRRAARLSKQQGELRPLAYIYDEMGRAHRALDRPAEALAYLKRSLALAEDHGAARVREAASQALAELYAERGDYRKAYAYHRQYSAAKDSMFNAEKAEAISQMQTRYETEKKEQQIENLKQESRIQALRAQRQRRTRNGLLGGLVLVLLLAGVLYNRYRLKRKANRLLEERKKEIQESLEEKELLVKEIHHRVKNNLQVISSLIGLQVQALEASRPLEAIRDVQGRVEAMALIHRKLYGADDLARIDVQDYLEELGRFLLDAFAIDAEAIRCEVQADDIDLNVGTAVPLGLIVNELVSNALEHAFPDGERGTVQVELQKRDDQQYVLRVADDGVGFPDDFGTQPSPSVGLTLVEDLTRQLGGTMHVENSVGVAYTIQFEEEA